MRPRSSATAGSPSAVAQRSSSCSTRAMSGRAAWQSSTGVRASGPTSWGRYAAVIPRRRTGGSVSGSSSPARMRRSVDLPEPFWPTTPMRASSATSMSRPSRTVRAPNDFTARAERDQGSHRPRSVMSSRGQDTSRGLLRRGVRDRDHAARARSARARGGHGIARARALAPVAGRRELRGQLPHDRHHLGEPPQPAAASRARRPRAALPERVPADGGRRDPVSDRARLPLRAHPERHRRRGRLRQRHGLHGAHVQRDLAPREAQPACSRPGPTRARCRASPAATCRGRSST